MPELPDVEITVRRLGEAVAGARIARASVPGINALRSFDPPLSALEGTTIDGLRRRGKLILIDCADGELTLVCHLMSAGRLQLHEKAASRRDKTARLLLGLDDGRELRLREFGSKQAAWVKLLRADALAAEETLAALGPEAWPDPPALAPLLAGKRPLHAALRDQHLLAGIGRTWVDEILHQAMLSPFKRGDDLTPDDAEVLRAAIRSELDRALEAYERDVVIPIPAKLEKPTRVHGHQGEPCPRDGTVLEAVFYEDYVMTYCPTCQTEGRVLKDRRLSRLLK